MYKHSIETRKKMSEAMKGLKRSREACINIGLSKKGKTLSKKHKEKISKKLKGRIFSKETKNKISEMKRKNMTLEIRRKISNAHKGEKAYQWKGGITPISQQIRKSFEYRIWREKCFQRDNYCCTIGGKEHGNKLEVDHYSITFSAILNKLIVEQGLENLYDKALKYEMFWMIDNGRTLCESCHRKTDTWGRKLK